MIVIVSTDERAVKAALLWFPTVVNTPSWLLAPPSAASDWLPKFGGTVGSSEARRPGDASLKTTCSAGQKG